MGGGADGRVDSVIAAGALVGAADLGDGLAGAGGVQLVGGLGVQPGHRAAQPQALRRHHAAVGRRKALAQRAGKERIHRLVGHAGQAVVAGVVGGHGQLVQHLLCLVGIGHQRHLALVHHGVELVHDHVVQHLAEVAQPQALVVGVMGDADAELVALAGVHHALHVVEPGVDLALDDRLEVRLHLRARDLDIGGQRVFRRAGINVRAVDGDLVILHGVGVPHPDQLAGHVLAGVELHLHVLLADDLALEGRGEGHGDGQLGDLDLDAPQLQGALHGLAVVGDGLQRAGHRKVADVLVHHHREAEGDGARPGGDDHLVQGAKGVHEGGYAFLGVIQQPGQVAGIVGAEDQRRADGDGDHVDHGGHVVAQGHHAEFQAQLHAGLGALLDDVADQEGHDALGLVVLDHLRHVRRIVRLAQHHGHAGDVAGDQRHAQGTDDGIGHEADAGFVGVGVAALDVLQALDDLRPHGGGQAGVQCVAQLRLVRDQALQHAHAGGQVAQRGHLDAGSGVDGRKEVGCIREGYLFIRAVFFDRGVHRALGQAGHRVGTGKDQISQCAHAFIASKRIFHQKPG